MLHLKQQHTMLLNGLAWPGACVTHSIVCTSYAAAPRMASQRLWYPSKNLYHSSCRGNACQSQALSLGPQACTLTGLCTACNVPLYCCCVLQASTTRSFMP
jgi:hypothetical protein